MVPPAPSNSTVFELSVKAPYSGLISDGVLLARICDSATEIHSVCVARIASPGNTSLPISHS